MGRSNAERQRAYRVRRRERRNASVTPAIPATETVTDSPGGIIYRDGHTYYAWADGRIYAVVCCQRPGCTMCSLGTIRAANDTSAG